MTEGNAGIVIKTKLRGVSFEDRQIIVSGLIKGQDLYWLREPNNVYDKNAIAVYADEFCNQLIGHLSAELARDLAVAVDSGSKLKIVCLAVTGEDKHTKGVNVEVQLFK